MYMKYIKMKINKESTVYDLPSLVELIKIFMIGDLCQIAEIRHSEIEGYEIIGSVVSTEKADLR